jgi:hypothetical protein
MPHEKLGLERRDSCAIDLGRAITCSRICVYRPDMYPGRGGSCAAAPSVVLCSDHVRGIFGTVWSTYGMFEGSSVDRLTGRDSHPNPRWPYGGLCTTDRARMSTASRRSRRSLAAEDVSIAGAARASGRHVHLHGPAPDHASICSTRPSASASPHTVYSGGWSRGEKVCWSMAVGGLALIGDIRPRHPL